MPDKLFMVLSYWGYYYLVFFSPTVICSFYTQSLQYSLSKPHLFTFINSFTEPCSHLPPPLTLPHDIFLVFLLFPFEKSVSSAGYLLSVNPLPGKKQFLVCSRSRCHVIQRSLVYLWQVGSRTPMKIKICKCLSPLYKMVYHLHITYICI